LNNKWLALFFLFSYLVAYLGDKAEEKQQEKYRKEHREVLPISDELIMMLFSEQAHYPKVN
jgi:hypothetical protein